MTRRARTLRARATPAERCLWRLLRARRFCGAKFRRQAPLGPFVVDFYCPSAQLVIEVDGAYHDAVQERDTRRDDALRSAGITVLHVRNEEILGRPDLVLQRITTQLLAQPHRSPRERGRG